jgi:hypothetical protein
MIKRGLAAVMVAAMLLVQGAPALANQNGGDNERRDGQSRYEVAPYNFLPLVLANQVRLRIAMMVIMMQSVTYNLLMAPGVEVTSQNRVGLGGLFGGIFAKTYSAEDFMKSLEVGTVYQAGDDTIAVALKDNLKLEDYRVIVFNGDNQYDLRDRPALRQIDRSLLAKLNVVSLAVAMLNHTLDPQGVALMSGLDADGDVAATLSPALQHDVPLLRKLLIGKVYIADNNTLLVVIPPAIVLSDDS